MNKPLHDEGVIKYQAEWHEQPVCDDVDFSQLIQWRQALFEKNLIGEYDDGVAYGNISQRDVNQNQFYISGSATGGLHTVDARHFSLVTRVDIDANRLWCQGPVIASSESMSHAVIYKKIADVKGIIHVHHHALWQKLINKVPTTPVEAPYGTPEMAYAIEDLIAHEQLASRGVFVMAGHEGGIFSFAEDLPEAYQRLMKCYEGKV